MKFLAAPFQQLTLHKDLVLLLTKRAIQARFRGSWLGWLWVAIQPLLLLAIYTFVFSTLYAGRFHVTQNETPVQFALGIFVGIILLGLFNETFVGSVGAITGNRNYVKKVVFPLEALPFSQVLSHLFTFSVSLSLALGGILAFGGGFSVTMLWLPAILAPFVLFCVGIAWIISAVGVYYRDISNIVQVIALSMLWMSGVFYSARSLPPGVWRVLRFNPVLLTIESARDVALWHLTPNLTWLAYCFGVGLLTFYCGYWFFRLVRQTFADVI